MRPIVLFAYNRPQYFQHTLSSLQVQIGDAEVYMFIDGPRNNLDVPQIEASVQLFEEYIPRGKVFRSDRNLGVAFNQKRGRDFIFKENDSAIFIEDDVILTSYYIRMLNNLMDIVSDREVSMVSCFGESHRHPDMFQYLTYLTKHDDPVKQQDINRYKICQMEHVWAYGMFKRAYQDSMDIMGRYYEMLPQEYRLRPHAQIYEYMESQGIDSSKIVSSQDSCLSASLARKSYAAISTFTANMLYIGEWGEHSRPDIFQKSWGTQYPFNEEIDVSMLNMSEDVMNQIHDYLEYRFLV